MKNNLKVLDLSISELKSYYIKGDLTPLEVSSEYIKRIKETIKSSNKKWRGYRLYIKADYRYND